MRGLLLPIGCALVIGIGVLAGKGPETRPSDGGGGVSGGGGSPGSRLALAVEAKPLSENVKRGLEWLVKNQHPTGGWGQGEESPQMRGNSSDSNLRDVPNLADTCVAALALMR